ncbi:MAG: hypothetical protein KZQ96_17115 [Candidatus Thiodiazotropha sp. (ex Lucinoma borealis)]|nr:hypothetical protein [Candidatus Thiodiazotropha sp. (ex Lucinoma borealis)]MCU7868560.1 hypothetical protein [Candidatus Thiodiazotropha sp. (ex Lucinoma borealis)]
MPPELKDNDAEAEIKERIQLTANEIDEERSGTERYISHYSVEDKVYMMRDALRESLKENNVLRQQLIDTGKSVLYGVPHKDSFWGPGDDSRGVNMTGLLLMEYRSEMNIFD